MVAERDSSVEEVPATYRKKTQMWLIIAFVMIALALFANMMYQIMSKSPKQKNAEPTQVSEQKAQRKDTDSDPDRFANLIDNRQAKINQRLSNPASNSQQPVSGYRQQEQPTSQGLFSHKSDPIKEAKAKFREQQIMEALKARGTRYGSSLSDSQGSVTSVGTQGLGYSTSGDTGSTNTQKIAEINQLKSSIQDRIKALREQAQEQRSTLSGVDQQISNADARLANVQSSGVTSSTPGGVVKTVRSLDQGASSNEPQVVGYAKDNLYGADTSGKIKLPIGTVINAITTFTAISDYMGGSMKAMITTDIYDADKTHVLIPKGSQLMIKAISASNVNEVIQNRMAFTVTWVILPNGNRIDFSKASILDRMGTPAVKADEVNYHFMAQLLGF